MNYISKLLVIIILPIALSNCVAIQAFPQVARAGDTITLAVGSLDGINRNNTTISYFSDSNPTVPIDLTSNIRSIIKMFPDKTSKAYWGAASGSAIETIEHQGTLSNHGAWQSVIVLDLPTTLPPGTGHFEIVLGPDVVYPLTVTKVDDVNIAMEILADNVGNVLIGAPHDFEYRKISSNTETNIGDLTELEQVRQVVVRRPVSLNDTSVMAAASYSLNIPIVDQFGNDVSTQVADSQIAVVLDDQTHYVRNQANLIWSRQGSVFNVIVTSVTGQLANRQIRFSILVSDLSLETVNGWVLGSTPSLLSLQYFDIDGNLTTMGNAQVILQ